MSKKNNLSGGVIGIIVSFTVVALIGGILFVGLKKGWFNDPKITLSAEYYTEKPEMINLDAVKYEELIKEKKSFVIFVDQNGCTTADRLRGYIEEYIKEKKIDVYKMMFSVMKESSLHNDIKYYPSVVIINNGKVRVFLRADSDEDVDEYNEYDAFKNWMNRLI